MTKNVTLLPEDKEGQQSWKLIGPDGKRIAAFDAFANSLLRNCVLNTRIAYCWQLAYFLDYLFEAFALLGHIGEVVRRSVLEEVIQAYDDYLVLGGASGKRIARMVDASMPSRHVSGPTSAQAHAAIGRFLKLSERVRNELVELSQAGLKVSCVDSTQLFAGAGGQDSIDGQQRRALLQHSVLAGVVSGGPQLIETTFLSVPKVNVTYDASRAFPFDKIPDFIIVPRSGASSSRLLVASRPLRRSQRGKACQIHCPSQSHRYSRTRGKVRRLHSCHLC